MSHGLKARQAERATVLVSAPGVADRAAQATCTSVAGTSGTPGVP